jgi:hypothetical protein
MFRIVLPPLLLRQFMGHPMDATNHYDEASYATTEYRETPEIAYLSAALREQ